MGKEDMIIAVMEWYSHAPISQQFDFKTCTEVDLITYHDSVGRDIRNIFGLWEKSWIPVIVDGTDVSEEHPDQISMYIIKEVWRRINAL